MLNEMKRCTKCDTEKKLAEYYVCSGRHRSECKNCTKKVTSDYQKKNQTWKTRFPDEETRKAYSRAYYHKNPDRNKCYRDTFKENHPDYYKNYIKMQKEKQYSSHI
jgi:hypothetical protein